jgi:hypothetical protein
LIAQPWAEQNCIRPNGKYTIRFWHKGFDEVVKEIEVKGGKVSALNTTFTKTRKPAFMGGP